MVAGECELNQSGEQEKDGTGNGDGEAGRVHLTRAAEGDGVGVLLLAARIVEALLRAGLTIAQRRLDVAAAAVGSVPGQHGDGDEGTAEEQVKDDGQEGKEGFAAEEAGQEHGEDGVQDSSA